MIKRLLPILVTTFMSLSDPAHASDPWPHYRGDRTQTGNTDFVIPDQPELLWSYKTGDSIVSSPVVGTNTIFIGSNDGGIHAINRSTGEKRWVYMTEGPVEAPPVLVKNLVIVGSVDGTVYALNRHDGTLVWKTPTEADIHGGATWLTIGTNTMILVGSYDARLYSLDLNSGATNWTFETDNYINGSPALDGSNTVFGGCDAHIRVVNALNGKEVLNVPAGAYIANSVAYRDGICYFGHYGNKVAAVNTATKTVLWEYSDRDFAYFSAPAIRDNTLIIGGRDKRLHAIDATNGKRIWIFRARDAIDSSPVICRDRVLFGSDDGRVYIVSLKDGNAIWQYEIGMPVSGSPAVWKGHFSIGSHDGILYTFGTK